MPQQTVVSQTAPTDVYGPATILLPLRPPNIATTASFGAQNGGNLIELHTISHTPGDIEASEMANTLPSPNEHTVEHGQQDRGHQHSATKSPLLELCGLSYFITVPLTSVFTILDCAFGTPVLLDSPPFNSMSVGKQLKASAAGFAVVGIVTSPMCTAVVRILSRTRYSDLDMVLVFFAVCALMSVLAMPLGFVMVPGWATKAFGAPHALAVSAAGLGGASVALSVALGLVAMVRWWCVVYL